MGIHILEQIYHANEGKWCCLGFLMFHSSAMCLMGFSTNPLFSSCPFYILTLYRSHWINANIYAMYHVTISSKPSYFFLEGEEKFIELKEMIKVTRLKKLRFSWLSKVLPKGIGSHWRGEASPMELPRIVTFAGVVLLVKW